MFVKRLSCILEAPSWRFRKKTDVDVEQNFVKMGDIELQYSVGANFVLF